MRTMKIYEFEMVPMVVGECMMSVEGNEPAKIVEYMRGAFDKTPAQESVWILFLTRKNKILGRHMISLGSQSSCIFHPREILRAYILSNSAAFVVVHNHPSGDPAPSAPDLQCTRVLRDAAKAVDASFLDHIIIGDAGFDPLMKGYFSFREAGLL